MLGCVTSVSIVVVVPAPKLMYDYQSTYVRWNALFIFIGLGTGLQHNCLHYALHITHEISV